MPTLVVLSRENAKSLASVLAGFGRLSAATLSRRRSAGRLPLGGIWGWRATRRLSRSATGRLRPHTIGRFRLADAAGLVLGSLRGGPRRFGPEHFQNGQAGKPVNRELLGALILPDRLERCRTDDAVRLSFHKPLRDQELLQLCALGERKMRLVGRPLLHERSISF